MKKIPLEILAMYLPYGVKAKFKYSNDKKCKQYVIGTVNAVYDDGTIVCHDTVNSSPDKFKLVLVPLDRVCNSPVKIIGGAIGSNSFQNIWFALKAHIDIFGLIEQGLAEEK